MADGNQGSWKAAVGRQTDRERANTGPRCWLRPMPWILTGILANNRTVVFR
jgi:hypothetical protein